MTETLSTPSVEVVPVAQAVHDLAETLTATPAYHALDTAADRVRSDPATQAAIRAYEAKRRQVEFDEGRSRRAPAVRAELERLWEQVEGQPAVIAYREAEADLTELCQEVNHVISHAMGLDFAANAQRRSCCG